MKYLTILAIPSILAAAKPLSPRQEEGQVALDADKLLNLRASFCLDYTKPECEAAIESCQADESKVDEDCILNEHPDCIEDQTSVCSQAAAQCLSDYGEEEDADQAVESCIIDDVFPESEEEKQSTEGGDEDLSNEIGEEEEAPSSAVNPEQAAACKKASAEYEVAILQEDCKEVNEAEEGVGRRTCGALNTKSTFIESRLTKTGSYRLNLFGFPNSPALKAQNLGIQEQRVALEWVRDKIAGFGGNASHIVLGGQSAGAGSGNAMLFSHADDAIIQGIALQSGTVQIIGAATENADAEFVRVATTVGCRDATDRARELRCMRDIDADRLHCAISNTTLNEFASPAGGSPMVDHEILFTPQEYDVRGREGSFARVPTLLGVTDSEEDSVLNWSAECGVNKTVSAIISASLFNCNVALESQ